METPNPAVVRTLLFYAALNLIMSMPEAAREQVVKALGAYFDNKPYAEILYENCEE